MKLTAWIRQQVDRLERDITEHSVFNTTGPATPEELADLRSKVALHTYLKQQLLRRETVKPSRAAASARSWRAARV